jgi:catechol 2,3-dioxygenase-like lactoylglutathione lyase family enzyme
MFLEHVNLTVSDLDRSKTFYRELFGLSVRWEDTLTDGRRAAHVGDERMYLALFEAAEPGRVENDYTRVGLNHFGFVVDDLDEMKVRLGALGVVPHSEQDYEPGRRLYFHDPDGIEVELVQYQPAGIST